MKPEQLKKMIKEELSVQLIERKMLSEIADVFTIAGGVVIGLAAVGILKRIANVAKVATAIGLENLQDLIQRKADKREILALKDTVNSVAAKFKDDQQLQLILQELEKYPHQEGKANRERISVIKKLKQYVESKLSPEEIENLEDIVATLRGKKKWGDETL